MDQSFKKPELMKKSLADGLGEKDFMTLYSMGQIRKVSRGGYPFKEGDRNDALFLVVNGECRIEPGADSYYGEATIFGKGDWVGELLFFPTPLHVRSVIAVTPTVVLEIDDIVFGALSPNIQSFIMKKLNDQTTRSLRSITGKRVHADRVNAYLTSHIRERYEEKSRDYEHSEVLQNVLKNIPKLPLFVTRLVAILGNENASIREITTMARDDPSLVSQILKTVNSSHYALKTKIADLNRAILYLGFFTG